LYKRRGDLGQDLWLPPHRIHLEDDAVLLFARFDYRNPARAVEREWHCDDRL